MKLNEAIHCLATLDYLASELDVEHNESVSAARHYLKVEKGRLEGRSQHCRRMNQRRTTIGDRPRFLA